MIRRLAAPISASLLALAACGSDDTSTTEPPPPIEPPPPPIEPPPTTAEFEVPTDPNAIVLQLDVGVNQPDRLAISTGSPIVTLYADGRLIARDDTAGSGALPPFVLTVVSPEGVRELLGMAIAAGGLDPLASYGSPNVADDDSISFIVATADRRSEFGVYGLGSEGDAADEMSSEQLAARADLVRLRDALADWQTVIGEHVIEPPILFTGERVMVIALDDSDVAGLGIPVEPGAYYENRVGEVYCAEVVIADSPGVVETLTDAPALGDRIEVRQVLPHEPGCQIIPDQ